MCEVIAVMSRQDDVQVRVEASRKAVRAFAQATGMPRQGKKGCRL